LGSDNRPLMARKRPHAAKARLKNGRRNLDSGD